MQSQGIDKLIKLRDAADLLGLSMGGIRGWILLRKIEFVKRGPQRDDQRFDHPGSHCPWHSAGTGGAIVPRPAKALSLRPIAEIAEAEGLTLRSYASVADSSFWPSPSDVVYRSGQTDGIPLCNYPRRIAGVRNEQTAIYGSSYLRIASNKKSDRDQQCPKSAERRLVQNVCVRDRRLDPTLATSRATTNLGRRSISVRYKELPRSAEANDSHYGNSTLRLGNQ
jgi:hypothetical protein